MEKGSFIAGTFLLAGVSLVFFPGLIDSATGGVISGSQSHNVVCTVQLKRFLTDPPTINSISCERTVQRCIDTQPLSAIGDYDGYIQMTMGTRATKQPINIGIGVWDTFKSYDAKFCVRDDVSSGSIKLYSNGNNAMLDQELFSI